MGEAATVTPFPAPMEFFEVGAEAIVELKPLFRKEWEEVGEQRDVIELDIDFVLLDTLLRFGRACIFVAKREGSITGYVIFTLSKHPKYKRTSWAFGTAFWISPDARLPRVAHRLIGFAEKSLAERGVQFVQTGSRVAHKAAGRVYASLGYEAYEVGWLKRLQ